MTRKAGDKVRLNVPENLQLHGAEAVVESPTPWGAHVLTAAAGTGRFRALHSEMRGDAPELLAHPAASVAPPSTFTYTGQTCSCCGSLNLRPNGPCLTCQECGTSTGC